MATHRPLESASAPLASHVPLDMHIKQWEHTKDCVEFVVVVQDNATVPTKHPGLRAIRKRFSQFQSLHKELRAAGFEVPDMPSADAWTNVVLKLTPARGLATRQAQLQEFLDSISQSNAIQTSDAVQAFVRSNATVLGYTSLTDVRIHPVKMLRQASL